MRSVSDLDMGVSQRQAFGPVASYARPKNLDELVNAYWDGKLVLPPHPDWEGEPTDWTADPFNDRNWQFQQHSLRWLNPLRWSALNGDQQSQKEWVRVVKSWAESNVPAEKSMSPYAWIDMTDGNRAIQLSLGAPFVKAEYDWFVRLLEYHRDWLMDESHIAEKNHGLHQHAGLLVVGAVLRDREAVETAFSRMSVQYESTFDHQGANDEGSTAYHQMNMNWWRQAWERARLEGMEPPPHISERLSLADNVLAHMILPNGQIPQIGDAARGRASLGHSEITDYVVTGGKKGHPPEELALVLDRGYVFSRSGWGKERPLASESHTIIRYGKELRSHSHRDRGSVHIYSDGERWLIDSGFHSYGAKLPENVYLHSRAAHNVADVLGAQHNPNAEVELLRSNITDNIHDFMLLDHGYGAHELVRRVVYLVDADCWIVSDRSHGGQDASITQRWHVEPGVRLRGADNGFRLEVGRKRFSMRWLGKGTQVRRDVANDGSLDAWIGTKWRTMTPSSRVVAQSRPSRPHVVVLFGAHRDEPLGVVESRVSTQGVVEAHLVRGGKQWNVVITDDNVRLS